MGSIENTQKSTNTSNVEEKGASNGGDKGAPAVGVAVAASVAAVGLLWKMFSSSSSGGKTMKAPGRDYRIFRSDFDRDPAGYFRDLRRN